MLLFQSESRCENDFDLHENETACRTHYIKGFGGALRDIPKTAAKETS